MKNTVPSPYLYLLPEEERDPVLITLALSLSPTQHSPVWTHPQNCFQNRSRATYFIHPTATDGDKAIIITLLEFYSCLPTEMWPRLLCVPMLVILPSFLGPADWTHTCMHTRPNSTTLVPPFLRSSKQSISPCLLNSWSWEYLQSAWGTRGSCYRKCCWVRVIIGDPFCLEATKRPHTNKETNKLGYYHHSHCSQWLEVVSGSLIPRCQYIHTHPSSDILSTLKPEKSQEIKEDTLRTYGAVHKNWCYILAGLNMMGIQVFALWGPSCQLGYGSSSLNTYHVVW